MKNTLIKIAICIVLTWAGWQLTDKGMSGASKEERLKYEQLCKRSVKTIGKIDEQYEQTNIKLIKGSKGADIYTFNYVYTVDNTDYKGHFTINHLPAKWETDVWYDPTNPSLHAESEPCERMEWYKKRDYPSWWAWIGIPLLLIGAGTLYSTLKSLLKSLLAPKPRQ
ncbi:hypothetical protein [Chitinophaga agri]|uniref:DUF3592 domain-containing protein n=1 Tax=Chitinophaga agri TaxID=2703787 RepID=A0A6B9ZCE7_9BACT|nr:hypothetical protein [Chitinophaga agri]QHS59161.1 hypothetical protein GWR21_06035 [Chitinophaga agri]